MTLGPLVALVVGAALAAPTAACAMPMFGFSTESPEVFHTVASEMPVKLWAPFVAWRNANELNVVLAEAATLHKTPMITWESWDTSVPYEIRTSTPAPGLSDVEIASGSADAYIVRQALYVKAYGKTVYIRFDHEMNGDWYPWSSINPQDYVMMWRHVWTIFHDLHVTNVRWIWSPNLNTWESDATFLHRVRTYWPGGKYVDIVGSTIMRALSQRGTGQNPAWFFARMDQLRELYHKPLFVSEALVDRQELHSWLPAFRQQVDARPYIKAVVWLSTIEPQQPSFGDMNWMLSEEAYARRFLTWREGYTPDLPSAGLSPHTV
jgi:hypothetical protein